MCSPRDFIESLGLLHNVNDSENVSLPSFCALMTLFGHGFRGQSFSLWTSHHHLPCRKFGQSIHDERSIKQPITITISCDRFEKIILPVHFRMALVLTSEMVSQLMRYFAAL